MWYYKYLPNWVMHVKIKLLWRGLYLCTYILRYIYLFTKDQRYVNVLLTSHRIRSAYGYVHEIQMIYQYTMLSCIQKREKRFFFRYFNTWMPVIKSYCHFNPILPTLCFSLLYVTVSYLIYIGSLEQRDRNKKY